jgi:hypothetical protein
LSNFGKECGARAFKLEISAKVSFLFFFRIHGYKIFVEAPLYIEQCFTKAFMDGTKIFNEETSCNNKLLMKKLKTSR